MSKKKKGKNKDKAFLGKVELITTDEDQLFLLFPHDESGEKVAAFGMGLEDAVSLATQIVDLVQEHVYTKQNLRIDGSNGKVFSLDKKRVEKGSEHERTD